MQRLAWMVCLLHGCVPGDGSETDGEGSDECDTPADCVGTLFVEVEGDFPGTGGPDWFEGTLEILPPGGEPLTIQVVDLLWSGEVPVGELGVMLLDGAWESGTPNYTYTSPHRKGLTGARGAGCMSDTYEVLMTREMDRAEVTVDMICHVSSTD